MQLTRPICFFDIEATGVDPAKDRIVELCIAKVFGGDHKCSMPEFFTQRFNPGITMSDEVIAVHGITNEMVADCPPFEEYAQQAHDFIKGCDLGGYNLLNYDVPLLWESFWRAGIEWDLTGVQIVDVGNIFKKKEERTLSAAVKFYCNREHDSAHSASGDVIATIDVLNAQLARYSDLQAMELPALAEFSRFDDRLDLAGKIVKDKDGDAVYNFGKSKGVKIKNDPGLAYWLLGKDFTQNTKMVVRKILSESETQNGGLW